MFYYHSRILKSGVNKPSEIYYEFQCNKYVTVVHNNTARIVIIINRLLSFGRHFGILI